jgi:alpha-glucosidase
LYKRPVHIGRIALGVVFGLAAGCAQRAPETAPTKVVIPTSPAAAAAIRVEPHAVTVHTASATVWLGAVNDSVFRVRVSRDATFAKDFSWAVIPGANAPTGALTVSDLGPAVRAVTPDVHVRIDKDPLRITFADASDQVISEDAPDRPMVLGAEGFRVYRAMPEDEHYYGLGDKGGTLDRRNRAFTNWNVDAFGWQESTDPLYKTIPFVVGLRKGRAYGLFLDDTWRTWFDFGTSVRGAYSFGSEGGELDYYFIAGPHPRSVLERYAALTGKPPLPPLWSLGFQQSRYSYFPESRVYEVAQTFRKKKIPADVIYLDIDYQKKYCPFTVDGDRFPHFERMVADLGKNGFRVIAITDLHVAKLPGAGYRPYDEGAAGDFFVHNPDGSFYVGTVWPGPSVFPDFTWAPARAWWGTLYRDFVNAGIAGFWNDMNEPSVFETPSGTMPLDVVHRVDSGGVAGHREVHNVFGMQNSRATYEGLLELQRDRRPFVLTRASYAGGQRFAASWTGDNSSTWNHYRMSVTTLLSLGVSGYPLVGDDIGGFRGSPPPDLLTRWFELGAFNPIFRAHSNRGSPDQEPWVQAPEHEAIRRRYIESRYRLMPYIYTLAEEASRTGAPLMRPLWLEHPEIELSDGDEDRMFLFGPDLLVEPKLDETVAPLDVLVPPGTWYDYWTGERWAGARQQKVPVGVGDLVVLVRGGAIIPHQPLVQSTAEIPKGPLELRVYPGADCRGSVYMDDGVTFEYQKGAFLRLKAACEESADGISVTTAAAEGSYQPWFGSIAFVIHGVGSRPKQVAVDGRPVRDFTYDGARKTVTVVTPYAKSGPVGPAAAGAPGHVVKVAY